MGSGLGVAPPKNQVAPIKQGALVPPPVNSVAKLAWPAQLLILLESPTCTDRTRIILSCLSDLIYLL